MIDCTRFAKYVLHAALITSFWNPLVSSFPEATAQTKGETVQRFELRIENGSLAGNLNVIRVKRGDIVELRWTADRRAVLHLHAYDVETIVDAGAAKTMSFRAHATGRFPIETHGQGGRHRVLIYLEVHPR